MFTYDFCITFTQGAQESNQKIEIGPTLVKPNGNYTCFRLHNCSSIPFL